MGAYLAGQAVSEKWEGGGLMPSFTFDANFALVHLSHAASNRRRLCFT